jgi:cardiolipin synthase
MRSLPNVITFARLLAVPLAVYCIVSGDLEGAFWVFVAAGVSDAVDGAIARLCDARTALGAFLDPLADKALLVSVYLSLAGIGLLPLWLVGLVVFRDLLIVGGVLLSYALGRPVAIRPLYISKLNTLVQLMLATWVLAVNGPGLFGLESLHLFDLAPLALLEGAVVLTTLLSGASYLLYGHRLFRQPE